MAIVLVCPILVPLSILARQNLKRFLALMRMFLVQVPGPYVLMTLLVQLAALRETPLVLPRSLVRLKYQKLFIMQLVLAPTLTAMLQMKNPRYALTILLPLPCLSTPLLQEGSGNACGVSKVANELGSVLFSSLSVLLFPPAHVLNRLMFLLHLAMGPSRPSPNIGLVVPSLIKVQLSHLLGIARIVLLLLKLRPLVTFVLPGIVTTIPRTKVAFKLEGSNVTFP